MNIQYIYLGNDRVFNDKDITPTSFQNPKSLDEYDINFIDLSSYRFWTNKASNKNSIDYIRDVNHLAKMISNSNNTKIIVLFPQNTTYRYHKKDRHEGYYHSEQMKNMIPLFCSIIFKNILNTTPINIFFENTETQLKARKAKASFYFEASENIISQSIKSSKPTIINYNDSILSTLSITSDEEIKSFLEQIGIIKTDLCDEPNWSSEIKILNDESLIHEIQIKSDKIDILKKEIDAHNIELRINKDYKSILYASGDKLVDSVFKILEEMISINLDSFIDEKKEDFLIELDNEVFIGEIKGISSNLKSTNLTQLELHYQSYLERAGTNPKKIHPILIICHQRKVSISERNDIDIQQIKLAKKYGSLIIETTTLLNIFQDFRESKISKEEFLELLISNKGLLKYKLDI